MMGQARARTRGARAARAVRELAIAVAIAAGLLGAKSARADEANPDVASTHTGGFRPHLVGDLRAMLLSRTDNNYFSHANTYAYSLDGSAGGVQLNLGAELLPRVALLASAHYLISGADRDAAHLRLQSGAVLGMVRWSFVRAGDENAHFDAALQGGFGRYLIKETYIDPAIAPTLYEKSDGQFGGTVGALGTLTFSSFMAVAGYGFHYAPATITDRIGGTVQAGGHEVSIGVGVWL
jgi:hypothetical protein